MLIFASILVLALAADDVKPGALVPIEAGVADRSATSTSLRIMPVEMSQSTNFQKVFGVVGRPDLLVRSQGGLYAVFDQGAYRTVRGRTYAFWPSGTVYHIGQPDFMQIKVGGLRAGQVGANLPPGVLLETKSAGGPDARIGAAPIIAKPLGTPIKSAPIGQRISNEPLPSTVPAHVPAKDVGYGNSSASVTSQSAAPPPPAAAPAADAKNPAAPVPAPGATSTPSTPKP